MRAAKPADERQRLEALHSYRILDTFPEPSYDDVTLLASEICGTPVAAISFIDENRQWFKSIVGLDAHETSRDVAFCAHAILNKHEPLIVEDATQDVRFSDNELVLNDPKIRFYAGTPLVTADGHALGTLCVIDSARRTLEPGQREALVVLGRQVVFQLQLRSSIRDLQETVLDLKKAEAEIERAQQMESELKDRFMSHVSHELRSPLTAIYQFVTILLDGLAGDLKDEQRGHLETVLKNANQLKRMIADLLEITRARSGKLSVDRQRIRAEAVINDVVKSISISARDKKVNLEAILPDGLPEVVGDPNRLRQILTNLIENALKFTPEGGAIRVRASMNETDAMCLAVEDTGCGLGAEDRERVFDHLYQVSGASSTSREGLGLGLSICKELVALLGGRIWVESEPGQGSRFLFTVPTFDLERLIAPILTPANLSRGEMALLEVNVMRSRRRAEKHSECDPFAGVLDVLRTCVNPSMDVVLPRLGDSQGAGQFVVVAMADKQGTDLLVKRIDEQLSNHRDTSEAGYEWHIEANRLSLATVREHSDLGDIATAVAEMLNGHLGGVHQRKAA